MNRPHKANAQKERRIARRYAAERRFRLYGVTAIAFAICFLVFFLGSIFTSGYSAFYRTMLLVDITLDQETLGLQEGFSASLLEKADYYGVLRRSVQGLFPEVQDRTERRKLMELVSIDAEREIRDLLITRPHIIGTVPTMLLSASSKLDQIHKGKAPRDVVEQRRILTDQQLLWYDQLVAAGRIKTSFNWPFFLSGDSRYPELAGIGGAVLGSILTLLVCLLMAFPVGVAAAVYMEEFAPKNRCTEFIEVNINNLAAVPSIIFGLLGLAVFLHFFGLPRSTPLVGGVVLALMTLPVIIISCRASLKAVPPSIREGALAIGASPVQVVLHHVLPLALPGTLTGTIIGLARALGETAPLLMIGMVAFIVDIPTTPIQPATALPVQIYLWAESAERGFLEKTSAAIMMILVFLMFMNGAAIYLRQRYERRW